MRGNIICIFCLFYFKFQIYHSVIEKKSTQLYESGILEKGIQNRIKNNYTCKIIMVKSIWVP